MPSNSSEYNRRYYTKNKAKKKVTPRTEQRRAYHVAYYAKHKEAMKAQASAWNKRQRALNRQYQAGQVVINDSPTINVKRKTAKDYHRIGLKQGFIWCGKLPKNVSSPTAWVCDNLHTTEKTYEQVRKGNRCYLCLKKHKEKDITPEAIERYRLALPG